MSNVIYGNMVGGGSAPLKTLILTDENGNEVVGVVTESVQAFNATPADVRINKTFVSDNGIETGENTITYRTEQGVQLIFPGDLFSLSLPDYDHYDYAQLQCMFALYNTNLENSVAVDKVVLQNGVFAVNSIEKIASVTKDSVVKSINFNMRNDSENIYCIYYFTYKQEEN